MIKVVLFDVGKVLVKYSGPQFRLYKLARELKSSGLKTAILSNVNAFQAFLVRIAGLYIGFRPVILSYKTGYKKPDPKIYELAIKMLGVKPDEIVFIDNRMDNILAAQKMGVHIVHAVSTKQTIEDIKHIIKKENKLDI